MSAVTPQEVLSDDARRHVERIVAAAPPLSAAQRSRLTVLLQGGAR